MNVQPNSGKVPQAPALYHLENELCSALLSGVFSGQGAGQADFAPFEELLVVLAKPFEDQPAFAPYMDPPQPQERIAQTFCGI